MRLTDKMKEMVERLRLCYVATVTPDGKPNLSPKGSLKVWDDERIAAQIVRLSCLLILPSPAPCAATSWALMTIRSYFQFDTRSRLRRFFASSEGWSSLNKR